MFDPARRRIGLRPVSPEAPNSYDLYGGSGIQVSCKKFFEFYGIDIPETRRYRDPKIIDGVLVVDL